MLITSCTLLQPNNLDHMAKIKDRLIFETKKMEAVERRKSNKEQTVMAKERHAHRIAEK